MYETAPVGYLDQPAFLNACVVAQTELGPEELLDFVKGIEERAGRVASFQNAPRVLDIDILLYVDAGGEHVVMESERLEIPHPRLHERGFVLGSAGGGCGGCFASGVGADGWGVEGCGGGMLGSAAFAQKQIGPATKHVDCCLSQGFCSRRCLIRRGL